MEVVDGSTAPGVHLGTYERDGSDGSLEEMEAMAFMILEDVCISCAACEAVCPNEAVSRDEDDVFIIDPARCTECVGFFDEQQCAEVCPVEACVPDAGVRETQEELLAKYRKLNPDKKPS